MAEGLHMTADCLRRYCGLAGIRGHDVHGLTRALRAFLLAKAFGYSYEELLNIADNKTFERFLDRARLPVGSSNGMTAREFLEHQHFVQQPLILARIGELLALDGTN